jgi:hypothetical protein
VKEAFSWGYSGYDETPPGGSGLPAEEVPCNPLQGPNTWPEDSWLGSAGGDGTRTGVVQTCPQGEPFARAGSGLLQAVNGAVFTRAVQNHLIDQRLILTRAKGGTWRSRMRGVFDRFVAAADLVPRGLEASLGPRVPPPPPMPDPTLVCMGNLYCWQSPRRLPLTAPRPARRKR